MFVKRKFFFSYSGSYGYKLIYVDEQYSRTSGKLISDITSESEYVEHYPRQIFINLLSWLKKIIAILKILLYVAFVKNSKKYKEKQYKERYQSKRSLSCYCKISRPYTYVILINL